MICRWSDWHFDTLLGNTPLKVVLTEIWKKIPFLNWKSHLWSGKNNYKWTRLWYYIGRGNGKVMGAFDWLGERSFFLFLFLKTKKWRRKKDGSLRLIGREVSAKSLGDAASTSPPSHTCKMYLFFTWIQIWNKNCTYKLRQDLFWAFDWLEEKQKSLWDIFFQLCHNDSLS